MNELRVEFSMQNDQLSYFTFFLFLEQKLNVEIEEWEKDAFELRLDTLGLAIIEFDEFN